MRMSEQNRGKKNTFGYNYKDEGILDMTYYKGKRVTVLTTVLEDTKEEEKRN